MLLKKYVVPALVSAALFAGAAVGCPVYAQDNSNSSGGFFGGIGKFFSRMWGGDSETSTSRTQPAMQKRENREEASRPGMVNNKMMPGKEASGAGKMIPGEEGRLNALVAQGKISEAQKTAIIAKMKSIQEELKSWAISQGINPQYVMLPGALLNMTKEGSPSGMQKPGMRQGENNKGPQNRESESDDSRRMMPEGQRAY